MFTRAKVRAAAAGARGGERKVPNREVVLPASGSSNGHKPKVVPLARDRTMAFQSRTTLVGWLSGAVDSGSMGIVNEPAGELLMSIIWAPNSPHRHASSAARSSCLELHANIAAQAVFAAPALGLNTGRAHTSSAVPQASRAKEIDSRTPGTLGTWRGGESGCNAGAIPAGFTGAQMGRLATRSRLLMPQPLPRAPTGGRTHRLAHRRSCSA